MDNREGSLQSSESESTSIGLEEKGEGQPLPKLWNANYIKVWSANFMIFFSFMLVVPLLPLYLDEEYGAGKHTIGVVLSGYAMTAMVARLFGGYIVDTYSRRTVLLLSYGIFACFFLGYLIGGSLILFAIVRTLHGAPFGLTTVSNSTVAIDVLPSARRAEGIGFYGLSNNLATAISPTIGLLMYETWHNYNAIFFLSFVMAALGVLINSTVKHPRKTREDKKMKSAKLQNLIEISDLDKKHWGWMSLDRFFLVKGWGVGVVMACLSFSYGVLSTYLAIYAKEQLGMASGAGNFFLVLSVFLMVSRFTGSSSLRKGEVVRNASLGMCVSIVGYFLFAALNNNWGFYGCAMLVGLGNGHMFPAMQTMFVNLAPKSKRGTANSSLLTSWDLGIGASVIIGGVVVELLGYSATFWVSWLINACGVAFFFAYVRSSYLKNRLR